MKTQKTRTPESRYVYQNDIKSHYADWGGTGQTVLLVHGNMRTSRSFDAVSRVLNGDSHVLAMDLIGHGNSTWTPSGYKFSDRSKDVDNFVTEKKLNGICAVGHSLGGAAVTMCAADNPKPFDKLVLLEPMMEVKKNTSEKSSGRTERPRRTYEDLNELREVLQNHKVTRRWTPEVIEDVVQYETYTNDQGRVDIKWSPETLSFREKKDDHLNLEPILKQLSIPILFVISEDGKSEFEKVFELEKDLDNVQCIVMSDTGHNMYMERPDALAKIVSDFVNSHELPRRV